MERTVTPLMWQNDIKNRAKSESIGNDFILLDDFSMLPLFNYPFKIDMLVVMICTKGTVRGTIDMQPCNLVAPFMLIVQPNQILSYEFISEDFAGQCLIFSKNFSLEVQPYLDERLPIATAIRKNPYAQLDSQSMLFIRKFLFILKRLMAMTDNPYRLEMIKHLTMVSYYMARPSFEKIIEPEKPNRQVVLVEKFTNLVRENYRMQRETAFYADKLCLTPKYLSEVIKVASGKSVSEWIDDYVILEAKALLKSTNMTIQQISEELNFPSQSFFGKYFKRNTGVSPSEYKGK
ncbi:MAG: helix-turn-helix domain-containing protein [Candidatus Symbiothrix sp.]|jgi:AraC-like DNA-binding protein|nr:helix-turn-helix domain-containing protein [Candidatus Symbiothrix sp.]